MSLSEFGFGEQNDSLANLNDFKNEIRSKSMSSSVAMDEPSTSIDTNQDETGKLLFPG